jgi:hypothetical protein
LFLCSRGGYGGVAGRMKIALFWVGSKWSDAVKVI